MSAAARSLAVLLSIVLYISDWGVKGDRELYRIIIAGESRALETEAVNVAGSDKIQICKISEYEKFMILQSIYGPLTESHVLFDVDVFPWNEQNSRLIIKRLVINWLFRKCIADREPQPPSPHFGGSSTYIGPGYPQDGVFRNAADVSRLAAFGTWLYDDITPGNDTWALNLDRSRRGNECSVGSLGSGVNRNPYVLNLFEAQQNQSTGYHHESNGGDGYSPSQFHEPPVGRRFILALLGVLGGLLLSSFGWKSLDDKRMFLCAAYFITPILSATGGLCLWLATFDYRSIWEWGLWFT